MEGEAEEELKDDTVQHSLDRATPDINNQPDTGTPDAPDDADSDESEDAENVQNAVDD